ncbi:hypothetical protein PR048_020189 [Dryococelus australis]|uniref:PiggyBac transposable element-derived protein domain-containing protein n=1 Tax=Dryococelus australis TaxID=614101 RepID=A0ABQ9H5M2_9NEOP|nr:hypothetical protein PR048_020189 [Dryococelus australis]
MKKIIVEYVAHQDVIDISNVLWKDYKSVMLLSTIVSSEPVHSVKRYDRQTKTTLQLQCSDIISQYNSYMGGVVLLESIVGHYKIVLRSKKWYFRLFYHLLDLSVINAWLLYRRVSATKCLNRNITMNLADFKVEVVPDLCKTGKQTLGKRGRPSKLHQQFAEKKKKGPAKHIPPSDIRLDQMQHLPQLNDKS